MSYRTKYTAIVAAAVAALSAPVLAGDAEERVPFVGCAAVGGADPEPSAAPMRPPKKLPHHFDQAAQLAFYQAADGPGVFAPRGWHCQAWHGADGQLIIVTPLAPRADIPRDPVPGPGVIASVSYGGTSGRFAVAEVSARVFPDVMREFIAKIQAEQPPPAPDLFTIRPYPDDQYTYLSPRLVEFVTPAHLKGIGSGILEPASAPVSGLLSLNEGQGWDTNLLQFNLRLDRANADLEEVLMDLELACIKSQWPTC